MDPRYLQIVPRQELPLPRTGRVALPGRRPAEMGPWLARRRRPSLRGRALARAGRRGEGRVEAGIGTENGPRGSGPADRARASRPRGHAPSPGELPSGLPPPLQRRRDALRAARATLERRGSESPAPLVKLFEAPERGYGDGRRQKWVQELRTRYPMGFAAAGIGVRAPGEVERGARRGPGDRSTGGSEYVRGRAGTCSHRPTETR